MANIFHVERAANKITLGTTGTTINVPPLTASLSLGLDASKNLESIDLSAIYQPLDTGLTNLAALGYVSDSMIKITAEDTYAIRTMAEVRTDLELVIGTDVQAYHANLAAIAGGTWTGAASITTLGTIATGTWQATDVEIAYGGTGQSTAQAAIDALTNVSAATNEHVLTKDTATGNAIFKAAAGADTEKVKVDVGATADYIGAANSDGVLRTTTGLSYTDGGNFVTLGLSHLGIEALSDPGVDRCLFWDDSESAIKWLTVMQGVQIYGTILQFDVNSLTEDTTPATNDYLVTYDISHATPGYEHKKVLISNFPNLYAAGDTPTINDSESNAILKDHAYLAQTSGFVTAWIPDTADAALRGYIGSTNDPAGAGTLVILSTVGGTNPEASVTFFVPNGKYFEITASDGTPTIIWTPLVSGGTAPIDQD